MKRTVTLLGGTGTIGDNMLALLRRHKQNAALYGLSAHKNLSKLADIIREFAPKFVALDDVPHDHELHQICQQTGTELMVGPEAIEALARQPVDLVVGAIVGMAGLPSVMAAVQAGQTIALANKESLVAAGHLVMPLLAQTGAHIIPVDSEHNAIHQCLMGQERDKVTSIILTASGGPFREVDIATLSSVKKEQALAHPNWVMGAKVSIDSATMMNKGLELLEAAHLFDVQADKLDAIIHPQSLIHGLVHYQDGSVIAHMASADMKLPLGFALGLESRLETGTKPLNLIEIGQMSFRAIEEARYPCYALAKQVIDEAPAKAIILNAANEVAVEAFLADRIGFVQIADIVTEALMHVQAGDASSLPAVFEIDKAARQHSAAFMAQLTQ